MKKLFIIGIFAILFSFVYVNAQTSAVPGICCVDKQGYCSDGVESSNCQSSGGNTAGAGSCLDSSFAPKYNQCKVSGCVFSTGRCSFLGAKRCEFLNGKVDASIVTKEQCNAKNSVSRPGSTLPTQTEGSSSLPVEEEVVYNNCKVGQMTDVRGYQLGPNITYTEEQKITDNMLGSRAGRAVNERKNGESWCVIYGSQDGKKWSLYPKAAFEIGDDHNSLWKDLPNPWSKDHNQLRREFSAGQRHAVYTCVDGDITVEQGDQFRAIKGICLQNDEPQFYLTFSESQEKFGTNLKDVDVSRFATCETSSGGFGVEGPIGNGVINYAVSFMKSTQSTSRVASGRTSLLTGGSQSQLEIARNNYHNGYSNAVLVDNYEYTNHCSRARYSVATLFYEPSAGTPLPPAYDNACKCGGGTFDLNHCEPSECFRNGDCTAHGGFGLSGCAKGALIFETLYLTAGSAGLHGGGGWGSIFGSGDVVPGIKEFTRTASQKIIQQGTPTIGGREILSTINTAVASGANVKAIFPENRNERSSMDLSPNSLTGLARKEYEISSLKQVDNDIWALTTDNKYVLLTDPDSGDFVEGINFQIENK